MNKAEALRRLQLMHPGYGPPDPEPGSCEECYGITRHDPDCPNHPKNKGDHHA